MTSTLTDVAARAGVSPKTVSRVVNDEPGVSPATRARVAAALKETGYSPDPAARSLRTGRSGVIGLAVPELEQPFFAEIADRIAACARRRGLAVVMGATGERGEGEAKFFARSTALDGVILYWQGLSPQALARDARRRPLGLPRENEHAAADRVAGDNERGTGLVLAHLMALGRERIAVIGVPDPALRSPAAGRARAAALRAAARRQGVAVDERLLIASAQWRRPAGAAAVGRLLATGLPFDALIALNDALALGALHALADAGVRVPDDVAVTGFDNLEASRYSFPSLTTVSPRLSACADDAVDLLAARIEDPGAPVRTLVEDVALLPRDSTIGGDAPWRPR